MIHVATVHWQSDQWIEPQLAYLARFTPPDTRVYAALNGLDAAWSRRFFLAEDLPGSHPDKLDALAGMIAEHADDSDLLVFLDGDAFPVAELTPSILGSAPLAAVRRDENFGEQQPHPCFCITTVGFWKELGATWQRGTTWRNLRGQEVTDTGGALLGLLRDRNVAWRPLLRTNAHDLHPLWFGVYDDVVYHHGAGFRERIERVDDPRGRMSEQLAFGQVRTSRRVPLARRLETSLRVRVSRRRRRRFVASNAAGDELAAEVYGWILDDPDFVRRFREPDA